MADISLNLFGRKLKNPVMNASGTLGYGREIEPLWRVSEMGVYVSKGLSLKPHHGNPTPRVWEVSSGMLNSIGLQNIGIDRFLEEYLPYFSETKTPVIINFFGFTVEEYVGCAERIKDDENIFALEMNLSCPNIKEGGIGFGKDPNMVFNLIKAVKSVTTKPIFAKLSPEVKNIVEIAKSAYEAGSDGLTLINTMPGVAVDIRKGVIPIKGGLSGPAIKPVALKAVYECRKAVPIPILGTGGIMSLEDALSFFMAGAWAIQVGTATFVDPYTIPRIIDGLKGYLEHHGFSSVSEITGITE
ncbi:MAG: dihydroorotate dehydrogenase [Syntrophorhabdaceae bacterium]|nr:dihydroorotate dehydrogenase [Syntrophorhabdaceae bacterium]